MHRKHIDYFNDIRHSQLEDTPSADIERWDRWLNPYRASIERQEDYKQFFNEYGNERSTKLIAPIFNLLYPCRISGVRSRLLMGKE